MEEFRRQFLLEAVATLRKLLAELQAAEALSDTQKTALFRTLHTVKGTSQTFGLPTASRLAHHLENLLAESKSAANFVANKHLLTQGIEFLIESLRREDFRLPDSFAEKINLKVSTAAASPPNALDDFSVALPSVYAAQLSALEKETVRASLENGKNLFCLEVGYDLATFAERLIVFRENLSSKGEIVAVLPSAKHAAAGAVGFQILLASALAAAEIKAVAADNAAQMIYDGSANDFSNAARSVLAHSVQHGEALAASLGKRIEFETSGGEIELAPERLKLVFEILLHLIRNAVDHAFDEKGAVVISLQTENDALRIVFADDGRGINAENVKRRAIEKNLVAADQILTEQEAFDLIFSPEFSTRTAVTEISGRGVGLDAVKHAVEQSGGSITVTSRRGNGTTFEILLPPLEARHQPDE